MVDPSQHAENRNWFESLLKKIPGFRGYLEKEYRRESDRMLRDAMADRLQRCKKSLDNYIRLLSESALFDDLNACERVKTKLDSLVNRFRGDVRGYGALFNYVKVNEERLEAVYQLDMAMVEEVDVVAHFAEELGNQTSPAPEKVSDLLRQLEELSRKYDQRGELLRGLEDSPGK